TVDLSLGIYRVCLFGFPALGRTSGSEGIADSAHVFFPVFLSSLLTMGQLFYDSLQHCYHPIAFYQFFPSSSPILWLTTLRKRGLWIGCDNVTAAAQIVHNPQLPQFSSYLHPTFRVLSNSFGKRGV
ncbi:MAG: hypothetical protein LBD16_08160, partial [Oscillospiraceae bacterium]|nr:hypothetical protein [Oscillospiraceae bacterium]